MVTAGLPALPAESLELQPSSPLDALCGGVQKAVNVWATGRVSHVFVAEGGFVGVAIQGGEDVVA